MNDQEKSMMLVKVVGWEWDWVNWFPALVDRNGNVVLAGTIHSDLYDPTNTELALLVIEWGANAMQESRDWLQRHAFEILIHRNGVRIALDKILELAIKEGLIKVTNE